MFMYGKILQWCKDHFVGLSVFVGLLVLAVVSVRTCQRHLDIDINATRNRITIEQRDSPGSAADSGRTKQKKNR